jgi:hypothetical protein
MPTIWHYTTPLDLLDHWQSLLAGQLGFCAAILVIWWTMRSERRRSALELEALRRALGVEVRQCVSQSFTAHRQLRRLANARDAKITFRMAENLAYLPIPVVFPACAEKIGLMGRAAMDVVIIYSQLELVREGIAKLARHRTPDDIPHSTVAGVADALIKLCQYANVVLPILATGIEEIDGKDASLFDLIKQDAASWNVARQEWPELKS